jgi:hypothetical protein
MALNHENLYLTDEPSVPEGSLETTAPTHETFTEAKKECEHSTENLANGMDNSDQLDAAATNAQNAVFFASFSNFFR